MHSPGTSTRNVARTLFAALLLLIGGLTLSARAATFVVTTTAGPGDGICTAADIGDGCTLREAIDTANAAAGPDIVDATGIASTQLNGPLPNLSSDITILGPGATVLQLGRLIIEPGATVNVADVGISGRAADGVDANLLTGSRATSGEDGGGIVNRGTLTLTRCTLYNCSSGNGGRGDVGYGGNGGGIYNTGTLTIIASTVTHNQSGNGGAGGGKPGGRGGNGAGIYNSGTATLVSSTVSDNRTGNGAGGLFTSNPPGYGGGICNVGTLTLTNCTISGNQTGTTFGGFDGEHGGLGGGLYAGGQTAVSNSTITLNRAENPHGVGIYGDVTLRSTIVDGIFGSVHSDGYNLINGQTGATIIPNPGAGPDFSGYADLEPLADNGGPTLTHLPRTNSPAIDKGKNFSGSSTDQRGAGFARAVDFPDTTYPNAADGTDIGAVEFDPTAIHNISTRARVETGDNAMIAGFIITGSAPKQVVLRGLGPTLAGAGVPATEVLNDPVIELRGAQGSILTNDNWKDTQRQNIEGGPFQPQDDRESVMLTTLLPSSYTLTLTGKNQTTGIGTVEVYDNNRQEDSRLANISTRGFVRNGSSVMIGGFTLGAGNPTRIAVRALGPSLSNFGLSNVLQDPTLELHDGDGTLLISNDNWNDDPASATQLSNHGLALPDPKEAGIFTDQLSPGQFTAVVASEDAGIGIALVEIYNLE
jgi:CSLREA domain-containing protein